MGLSKFQVGRKSLRVGRPPARHPILYAYVCISPKRNLSFFFPLSNGDDGEEWKVLCEWLVRSSGSSILSNFIEREDDNTRWHVVASHPWNGEQADWLHHLDQYQKELYGLVHEAGADNNCIRKMRWRNPECEDALPTTKAPSFQ